MGRTSTQAFQGTVAEELPIFCEETSLMQSHRLIHLALLCSAIALQGCSTSPVENSAIAGGVAGGAIGAGTGALIGNAMVNGSVSESALVGGAIGIPVGIVLGVALHEMSEANERDALDEAIERNDLELKANQRTLESARDSLREDAKALRLPPSTAHTYDGHTLGDPYR